MAANKKSVSKGIKYLTGSLPLLFLGPTVIHNAFINKQNVWHYLVLAIGMLLCFGGVYCMFIGIKKIVYSLFND